jgi:hypothetical protein
VRLSEIEKVIRIGSILLEENGRDFFQLSAIAVRQVKKKGVNFEAPSASSAALWLLRCAHANALAPEYGRVPIKNRLFENSLLGFRGQAAKYTKMIPSLYRRASNERPAQDLAFWWFYSAISAWHSAHFRYLYKPEEENSGVELEAAIGAAQHYGIGTFLLDWTWDPLVALTFAIHGASIGERVAVYLQAFPSDLARSHNVLLPPSFLERVWRQRGFFACHAVAPEDINLPGVLMISGNLAKILHETAIYHRISFTVSDDDLNWARRNHATLMEDPHDLESLAKWALRTAEAKVRCNSIRQAEDLDTFLRRCNHAKIDPPPLISVGREAKAFENVRQIMDYIDVAALRIRPGVNEYAYFKPALLTVVAGLPWKSWITNANSVAAQIDRRASVFPSVISVDQYTEDCNYADAILVGAASDSSVTASNCDLYWCKTSLD